jgi:hypothetical protein
MSPTDVEAWAELSDLYLAEALYAQSCFCLEEVLLITPNAWNVCSGRPPAVGVVTARLIGCYRSMPGLGKFCIYLHFRPGAPPMLLPRRPLYRPYVAIVAASNFVMGT